jgi:hypothetical protein
MHVAHVSDRQPFERARKARDQQVVPRDLDRAGLDRERVERRDAGRRRGGTEPVFRRYRFLRCYIVAPPCSI